MDARKLKRRLGVNPDRVIGPGTMTAMLVRCGAKADIGVELGLAATVHLTDAGILAYDRRLSHAITQLGHESDGFGAMEECATGRSYEGRSDLGNIQAGDGIRYKGCGPIQMTSRANYRRYGRILGIDIERRPEVAAFPSVGLMVSCAYWVDGGLNNLADRDDLEGITRRINGGLNGLADRRMRLTAMQTLLA